MILLGANTISPWQLFPRNDRYPSGGHSRLCHINEKALNSQAARHGDRIHSYPSAIPHLSPFLAKN